MNEYVDRTRQRRKRSAPMVGPEASSRGTGTWIAPASGGRGRRHGRSEPAAGGIRADGIARRAEGVAGRGSWEEFVASNYPLRGSLFLTAHVGAIHGAEPGPDARMMETKPDASTDS